MPKDKKIRTFRSIGSGKCIICGTSKGGRCFLAGKDGTSDGHIEEAAPIHVNCLYAVRYSPSMDILYMRLKP